MGLGQVQKLLAMLKFIGLILGGLFIFIILDGKTLDLELLDV